MIIQYCIDLYLRLIKWRHRPQVKNEFLSAFRFRVMDFSNPLSNSGAGWVWKTSSLPVLYFIDTILISKSAFPSLVKDGCQRILDNLGNESLVGNYTLVVRRCITFFPFCFSLSERYDSLYCINLVKRGHVTRRKKIKRSKNWYCHNSLSNFGKLNQWYVSKPIYFSSWSRVSL